MGSNLIESWSKDQAAAPAKEQPASTTKKKETSEGLRQLSLAHAR